MTIQEGAIHLWTFLGSDRTLWGLAELVGKVSIVLALAWIVALALRRGAAATRHLVWAVAVVAVLGLPAVGLLVPDLPVVLGPAPSSVRQSAVPTRSPLSLGPGVVDGNGRQAQAFEGSRADRGVAAAGGPTTRVPTQPARPVPARVPTWPWQPLLMVTWAIGTIAILALLGVERGRLGRLARAAQPCGPGRVRAVADRLLVDWRRRPALLEAPAETMPIAWGLIEPTILMPRAAEHWSTDRIEAVLRHELAHVRRRDQLVQVLATCVAALYWFHPLAWVALAQLHAEREQACDDEVLGSGARPSAYAEILLELAARLEQPRLSLSSAAMARSSQLGRRVCAVLEERRPRRALERAHVRRAALVGLAVLVPLAGVEPTAATRETSTAVTLGGPAPAAVTVRGRAGRRDMPVSQRATSECWAPGTRRSLNVNRNRDEQRESYRWESRNCRSSVLVIGQPQFNDDFTSVTGISRGGYFRLEHAEDGVERLFEVRSAPDGAATMVWWIDGEARPFDLAAERWLSELLPGILQSTGLAAEAHVAWIVEREGAEGVLRQVRALGSNGIKARYLRALLGHEPLDDAVLEALLDLTGSTVGSNSAKRSILTEVAARHRSRIVDGPVAEAFWRATATIESNSALTGLLESLIADEAPDSSLLARALAMAGTGVSSNSARARFALALHGHHSSALTGGALHDEFWGLVEHIDSNSALANLLLEVSKDAAPDSPLMQAVMTAAERLTSSSGRANFLLAVRDRHPDAALEGSLGERVWALASGIDSSSTLANLLLELTADVPDESPALDRAVAIGRDRLDSSSALARLLTTLAEAHPRAAAGRLRPALLEAAERIGSRSTRARVLERLGATGSIGPR